MNIYEIMREYHQGSTYVTQPDLLIVNHDHSCSASVCAMCFWEHVEMFVIVSGPAIWVYATNYLTKRAQEDETRGQ